MLCIHAVVFIGFLDSYWQELPFLMDLFLHVLWIVFWIFPWKSYLNKLYFYSSSYFFKSWFIQSFIFSFLIAFTFFSQLFFIFLFPSHIFLRLSLFLFSFHLFLSLSLYICPFLFSIFSSSFFSFNYSGAILFINLKCSFLLSSFLRSILFFTSFCFILLLF